MIWLLLGLGPALLAIARRQQGSCEPRPKRSALALVLAARCRPTAPPEPLTEPRAMRSPDSIRRNTGFALAMRMVSALFTGGADAVPGPLPRARRLRASMRSRSASVGSSCSRSTSVSRVPPPDSWRSGVGCGGSRRRAAAARSASRRSASGLGALALVALAGPISSAYGTPSLVWPLRIVALALVRPELHVPVHDGLRGPGRELAGLQHRALGERSRGHRESRAGPRGSRRDRGGRRPGDRLRRGGDPRGGRSPFGRCAPAAVARRSGRAFTCGGSRVRRRTLRDRRCLRGLRIRGHPPDRRLPRSQGRGPVQRAGPDPRSSPSTAASLSPPGSGRA